MDMLPKSQRHLNGMLLSFGSPREVNGGVVGWQKQVQVVVYFKGHAGENPIVSDSPGEICYYM